jgi:predicted NACHT family NTPase
MIRPVVAYLLIVAVMSASFSRLFVYAGFEMNRNYIAAHLCENRHKPWLHCNGKCYFIKKIRQAEEKEKSDERQSQKNLFQEAMFAQKAEIRFYSHVVQVMPVPNQHFTLPVACLSVYQPPRLG